MILLGLFVTGTGTGVGKTWVSRGVARAIRASGRPVVAIKPMETGCDPMPADAVALGQACGDPSLATAEGLYRARKPLSPYAAVLEGEPGPPDLAGLAERCHALGAGGFLLVEGAGGLLVPVDRDRTMADFARELALPLLCVASDALGVLSHVLTAVEAAAARDLKITGVVLTQLTADDSTPTNRRILEERVDAPVLTFPRCEDDDDALARTAETSGVLTLIA